MPFFYYSVQNKKMKAALITGANRGIGFETAMLLGLRGYFIFLTSRNKDNCEAAVEVLNDKGINSAGIVMDVNDEKSISNAYVIVKQQVKMLDVLINNAGILLRSDNDIIDFDIKDVINTFRTNLFGPILVVKIFSALLKKGSRIINVSSGGGALSDPVEGWAPAYCISKAALNMLTKQQAYFLSGKGVSVNSVCPGWVRTKMGGRGATRNLEKGAETIVWLADEAPQNLKGKFFRDKKEIEW